MTYRECCKVLGIYSDNELCIEAPNNHVSDLEKEICNKISTLNKLIICSKAYWKQVRRWVWENLGSLIGTI